MLGQKPKSSRSGQYSLFQKQSAMSDVNGFSVSLQEHGRLECAATILLGLLYPEWPEPDGALDSIYLGLCGYVLRAAAEQPDGWAEERQLIRPIYALISPEKVKRAERDIATRLPKALWTGLVAWELITGVRSLGKPGDTARTTVAPIAEDMAGHLKMSASNLKARAWRPWARAAHLCATFAHFHLRSVQDGQSTFRLIEFLIGSDAAPLAFADIALSLEDAVAQHSRIPANHQDLVRVRISEKGS